MNPTEHYEAAFVESFPTPMQPGFVYVSTAYSTAGHLCPCGCGSEIVTKLSPVRYKVTFDGEISLSPSVAATAFPCNSHYFITRGKVDWHSKLDPGQAALARAVDRRALEEHRDRPSWVKRMLRAARRRRS